MPRGSKFGLYRVFLFSLYVLLPTGLRINSSAFWDAETKTRRFENDLIPRKAKWGIFKTIYFQKTKTICFRGKMKKFLFRLLYIKEKKENDLISLLSRLFSVGGLFYFPRAAQRRRPTPPLYIIPQRSPNVKPLLTNGPRT